MFSRLKVDGICARTMSPQCWRDLRRKSVDDVRLALSPAARDALSLWESASSQWRIVPMGGVIGLDYTAVAVVADALAIEIDSDVFNLLRGMELVQVGLYAEEDRKRKAVEKSGTAREKLR